MPESLSPWLALREPVDHASRSEALTRTIVEALPAIRPLRLVDLGSGTGSNIRYLAPRLPAPQSWVAIDRDPVLMTESVRPDLAIQRRVRNLGEWDPGAIRGAHLVTASALLDLVSERWLRDLAGACRAQGAAVLFALTYDGSSRCHPAEPEDDRVRELFNAHQRQSDKGFGPAAGPDAVESAAGAFEEAGYRVRLAPSHWDLTAEMTAVQSFLIDGWAAAASEMVPPEAETIAQWRARRLSHVHGGRSHIVVGHQDLAATL